MEIVCTGTRHLESTRIQSPGPAKRTLWWARYLMARYERADTPTENPLALVPRRLRQHTIDGTAASSETTQMGTMAPDTDSHVQSDGPFTVSVADGKIVSYTK
jgi:hypothetical protein